MKLIERTVSDYLQVMASRAPAPGGGSASAFCGAQGAGLIAMAAALTLGQDKFAAWQDICRTAQERALALTDFLTTQIDADSDAFDQVSAAYRMPKTTDDEKAARSAAIRRANRTATQVPLRTMELAAEAMELGAELVGRSNPNCASDLAVGVLNLLTAAEGAWFNVKINLSGLRDPEAAADFAARADGMLAHCRERCEWVTGALSAVITEA